MHDVPLLDRGCTAARRSRQAPPTARLAGLWVYPIKSCAGFSVETADAEPRGLAADRRWMWVDAAGQFISQRTHPQLALVRPTLAADGVVLHTPGAPPLHVAAPPPATARRPMLVWGGACEGADAGDPAARWLADALGIDARLMVHRGRRAVDPRYAAGHEVAFADGFPLLIASAEAVAQVAGRSGRSADVRRFRPNLVVAGAGPFAEDQWRTIAIGDVEISLVKPCGRCGVLDVDPDTGARDIGLLATLRADRLVDGELRFGVNAVVTKPGRLHVGAPVRVLARR